MTQTNRKITERFDDQGRLYERITEEIFGFDEESDCCECAAEEIVCGHYAAGNEEAYRVGVYKPECITIPLTDNIKLIPAGTRAMNKIHYIEINDTLRLVVDNGKIVDWYEPLLNRVLD